MNISEAQSIGSSKVITARSSRNVPAHWRGDSGSGYIYIRTAIVYFKSRSPNFISIHIHGCWREVTSSRKFLRSQVHWSPIRLWPCICLDGSWCSLERRGTQVRGQWEQSVARLMKEVSLVGYSWFLWSTLFAKLAWEQEMPAQPNFWQFQTWFDEYLSRIKSDFASRSAL